MKAMVLAAGLGSRLKKITESQPKCLVKVGGKAMLEHVVEKLKEAEVSAIGINLHHQADQIRDFLSMNNNFGIAVEESFEETLLDTGGGLKQLSSFFQYESCFLMHNSDIYHNFDLKKLISRHIEQDNLATIAVMKKEASRCLLFDSNDCLIGWRNKQTGQERLVVNSSTQLELAYTGIQVLSPAIFEFMPEEDRFSIIEAWLAAARAGESIKALCFDGFWEDIGTPDRLDRLNKSLDF